MYEGGGVDLWKASVSVLTVTHALTNRSNVIPRGGPYTVAAPEAGDKQR